MSQMIFFILSLIVLCASSVFGEPKVAASREFQATGDYSSEIEKQIRSGRTTTAKLIVPHHPRIWLRGSWDLDKNHVGSFAWRIAHGPDCSGEDPSCDNMKDEFCFVTDSADTYMYGKTGKNTYGRRYLWPIMAAEGVARKSEWGLPLEVPWSSGEFYNPRHTEDQFLSDARAKLLSAVDEWDGFVGAHTALHGAAGYDWLVRRKYADGVTPVLSETDRVSIQSRLIKLAEMMKADCRGQGQLFGRADQIYKYFYPVIGMALYEPDGKGISAENNRKAKEYLDDFDAYWIGKILPALNEQGGTGGWQGGLCHMDEYPSWGYYGSDSRNDTLPYSVAPLLYAHYTATGQSLSNSVYDTGFLKYAGEFLNYMIYPDGRYVSMGPQTDEEERYTWIGTLFSHARRRFSSDPYDQWMGELIGWVRQEKLPHEFVDEGSYDMFDQLMFEEKFPNPRTAGQLGCGTRHFAKLGWVAMRSGFTSSKDLAALFICQRYHWSDLNPYSQNSFHIMRRGWLIKGNKNTIYVGGQYQRPIQGYPTVAQGVQAYSPGSKYDVGPGIQGFESNRTYDYIKGDATHAYDPAKLKKFTRQWVHLKPDIFVVFDHVITTKPDIEKKWVAVPATPPTDLGNNILKISNGHGGALWIKRLLPLSASVSLSGGQIAVVPSQKATEAIFLHVMQAVDSGTGAEHVTADDASVVVEGDRFLVSVGGHKMRFSKEGGFEWIGNPAKVSAPSRPNRGAAGS